MQDRLRFDLSGLAKLCKWLLLAFVLAEMLYAADSYAFRGFLDAVDAGTLGQAELEAVADRVDRRARVVGLIYLVAFFAAAIFSGVWIYRASWNARQIQPVVGRITPGWAVGWLFVPFLSLWKPYQAMTQTWASSVEPERYEHRAMPGFAGLWWACWVISNLLSNASFKLYMKAETTDDYRLVSTLDLITAPISILSAVLFLRLITTITEAQRGKVPAEDGALISRKETDNDHL